MRRRPLRAPYPGTRGSGFPFAVHIPWLESLVIAAAALLLTTLAGLGPALHAVRQRIPEAIAYE